MKYIGLLVLLMGCSAEQELNERIARMEDCKAFKAKVDQAKVLNPPASVQDKIDGCKYIGVWE